MAFTLPTQTISAPVSDVPDPITNSAAWATYTINGVPCPGVIPVDGLRGFERETGWDRKKGKGTGGAILTMTTWPPAEGSITSILWLPEHFALWDEFSSSLEYHTDKVANTPAAKIGYPALAYNLIYDVVVHKVGIPRHHGKKLYSVTVDYIEWMPPPKATIVSTPIQPGTDFPQLTPGDTPPNQADASAGLQQALAENAAAGASNAVSGLKGGQ